MIIKKLKKTALWLFLGVVFFAAFSLATASGVKYVTNRRLIAHAALALEDSIRASRRGECISGEWGAYRAWGRYEPKMWHQIAMLYDIEKSPLTTPGHKNAARKAQEELVSYFQHDGADYVNYVEETFGPRLLRDMFADKMEKAIDEADVDVAMVLRQMKPAGMEMMGKFDRLFEGVHGISRKALIIYHMRLANEHNGEAD